MTPFFQLYYELKAKWPGCPEEYYHREIQEQLGYECLHPPMLLQDMPGGRYIVDLLVEGCGKEWYKSCTCFHFRATAWCPVCQSYPYTPKNKSFCTRCQSYPYDEVLQDQT